MIGSNAMWDINPDLMPGMEKPPTWAQGPASSQAWNYLYSPIRYSDAPAGGVAMPDGRMNPGVRKLPSHAGKSIFDIKADRLAKEAAAQPAAATPAAVDPAVAQADREREELLNFINHAGS